MWVRHGAVHDGSGGFGSHLGMLRLPRGLYDEIAFGFCMLKIPIEIFLSHADEDRKFAKRLAEFLREFEIKVFLAHDNIDAGEDWEKTLSDKITNCDIFLALITENFHKANYTDHEVGIAYGLKKPIIPVSVGKVTPYGFLSKIQSKKISERLGKPEIRKLVERISVMTGQGRSIIDNLIEKFAGSRSFYDANHTSDTLFSYAEFTKQQINNIARAYADNIQIRDGFRAGKKCENLIKNNWNGIDKKIQSKIDLVTNINN